MKTVEEALNLPVLTLAMLKTGNRVNNNDYYSHQVYKVLKDNDYGDLGWKNTGVHIPMSIPWDEIYRTNSGGTCIYVNHYLRIYHSVDMGD